MTQTLRGIILAALCALAVVAGWRIFGLMQAELRAESLPERALQWRPHDPRALQRLADRQLAQGRLEQAAATARSLLAHEPLAGGGFRILATVAERQGRVDQAFDLYRIAERRAPRDLAVRAWLAEHHLAKGEHAQALSQIDKLLRLAPRRAAALDPVLVKLARDPAFASALADALRADPPWRAGTLAALRHPQTGDPEAAGWVLQALQDKGGLSAEEYAAWLDSLIAQGRWGEAYARWASPLAQRGRPLPPVFNGDFAQTPGNAGFDWRIRRIPGVLLEFVPVADAQGRAAYLRFLDRRVPQAGLEQALVLAPGRYVLETRLRAQGLRSALGLEWVVDCAGDAGRVGRSEPLEGTFGWRHVRTPFTVPASGCPGQWLRLSNPVPDGAAQRTVGDLWINDVKIHPQR